jgi:hypothetical protein
MTILSRRSYRKGGARSASRYYVSLLHEHVSAMKDKAENPF